MDRIVLISQIPLWSMGRKVGGPAFQQTVEHLARDFKVSLVQPRLDYVDPADLPDNVELHQFDHAFHGLWRDIPKLGWITDTLGWYSFSLSAWPVVSRLCRERDVKLVYGYEIYGSPVGARAARKFALPLVTRFQGTLMSSRRHMRLATLRFWKHVRGLGIRSDLVIMTNDGTEGLDYLLSLDHEPGRIRFWMNGYDPAILQAPEVDVRRELGLADDERLLLTVSRLSGWKRIDRALRVHAQLLASGVKSRLVIAGSGPEEERLKSLAASLGVTDSVIFAGGVSREHLASYYRAADLLLSLYDYSNLANPVIEAMVLGTPVIAYDAGGTSDLVVDGVNGLLVKDADDPQALAALVSSLLKDPDKLAGLGASASEWARENLWTWDARMDAEVQELKRLIASR